MATTSYGINDALTVKRWARRLAVEALKATEIAPLIGTSSSSIIHKKNELKEGGDKVTFGLRTQLSGDGVTEAQVLEGNEESLTTYSDSLTVNELVHGVRVKGEGTIDNQRVLFNAREEGRQGLTDWFAKRLSASFFNQVCGYTPQTNTLFTGLNATTAPSSGNQIWVDAASNNSDGDENLASDDVFALKYIDYAKEMAQTMTVPIRPLKIDGEDKYVLYLHPYQVTDLRTSTSTGQWLDIQKAVYMGSRDKNPIYSGALGEYNGVILRSAFDVTQGAAAAAPTTAVAAVRRAVLLGAQAASMAFGSWGDTESPYKWVEKTFDYDRELGISVQSLMGMKKNVFNSKDFGSVVISSYAAAHT